MGIFFLQLVRSAIVPLRSEGKWVTRAFLTIAVLALAQVLAGSLWAQEQDSKKILGQRLVDEIPAFLRGPARGGEGHPGNGNEREIDDSVREAVGQLRAYRRINRRGF